jgi:uncharacterized membrane protein
LNLKDPESMNAVIGNVLRYGVVLSAAVIFFGIVLLISANGGSEAASLLAYNPNQVPPGNFNISFQAMVTGLGAFDSISWIELGAILLIATPVSRVLISVFLFAAEGDRLYVVITAVVLFVLLFSMLVTPFIPLFHG